MYTSVNSAKEASLKSLEEISNVGEPSQVDATSQKLNGAYEEIFRELPNALNISLPGQAQYEEDIHHWAFSSSQKSAFTYQPDTAKDVSTILRLIDKKRLPDGSRIPFGVKSGGHTGNLGFSSSPGVLISMKRFDQVVYHPESQTAVIGAGQIWDNVYKKLLQHKVSVLGARVTHIGVAGFLLGGGYSWHTNQHGLAIDTITEFELVKPDGTIVNVTQTSDPELFFALRGGGNNFGIVTAFTMKTFPQGDVWGGPLLITNTSSSPEIDVKIKKLFFAVQTFMEKATDPKAAILATLGNFPAIEGKTLNILNIIVFYDGPSPPAGLFDVFKEIAPEETAREWHTRSYPDLVEKAILYGPSENSRGAFHTVGLSTYTPKLLEKIWEENEYWGFNLKDRILLTYSVEPFLPDILAHGSPSAYPSNRSVAFSPFPIYVSWEKEKPEYDKEMQDFARKAAQRIQDAAKEYGIQTGEKYPNYAISGTPLQEMYGSNVEKLNKVKARVDPSNLMGLAGGFKF